MDIFHVLMADDDEMTARWLDYIFSVNEELREADPAYIVIATGKRKPRYLSDTGEETAIRPALQGAKPCSFESEVTELLHGIGVPANIRGYQYLRDSILFAIYNPQILHAITKELYPAVAQKEGTTPSRVERAIRHAIEVAWDRGEKETIDELFGYTVSKGRGKPTNSEFIALLADRILVDRRDSDIS